MPGRNSAASGLPGRPRRRRGLGAPVASIGGAGTFDGIFLIGIMAVLLAGFSRWA